MAKKTSKGGLGRGLDSLLPSSLPSKKQEDGSSPTGVNEVPLNQIETNPFQPRTKV